LYSKKLFLIKFEEATLLLYAFGLHNQGANVCYLLKIALLKYCNYIWWSKWDTHKICC